MYHLHSTSCDADGLALFIWKLWGGLACPLDYFCLWDEMIVEWSGRFLYTEKHAELRGGYAGIFFINSESLARYAFVTSPPKCFWSGEKPLKPLIMWNDGRFCRHFLYMTAFFAATFGIWRHFLPSQFSAFCEWRHFLPSLFWIWRQVLTAFWESAVAFCRHISNFLRFPLIQACTYQNRT